MSQKYHAQLSNSINIKNSFEHTSWVFAVNVIDFSTLIKQNQLRTYFGTNSWNFIVSKQIPGQRFPKIFQQAKKSQIQVRKMIMIISKSLTSKFKANESKNSFGYKTWLDLITKNMQRDAINAFFAFDWPANFKYDWL